MKWVTRAHAKVDRIACPWLIRRFIDSDAEFVFAAPSRVQEIVDKEGAIPFDVPGAELGHAEGKCSFDSFMEKYKLGDKALQKLAAIVNGADTKNPNPDPRSAGLLAIATGYSLLFPNDMENMEYQFQVYDALYAWCRLEAAKAV